MPLRMELLVCGGTGCQASNSSRVLEVLREGIQEANLQEEVRVLMTGCFGFCEKGPIVKVMPDNIFYVEVDEESARKIVREHVIKGRIVEEKIYKEPKTEERLPEQSSIPFYKKTN